MSAPAQPGSGRVDGGELVLQGLRDLGIEYVFSSPGSEWGPVWEAFARQQVSGTPGPAYLQCGHETLAVDLAIGYTAITGRMQAVLLHAGAGLLQGALGLNAARVSGTPMVVMSGESLGYGEDPAFDPGSQWYGFLGVVGGPQRLVEPLVKWGTQAGSVHTLREMVVRAGEMAQRVPAGPTFLNVPIEVMMAACPAPAARKPVPPAPKAQPLPAEIERIAALLASARHPVIAAESAGRERATYDALGALAELLAIPVAESPFTTASNFPKDNPLHAGVGMEPHLDRADLVLAVRNRAPWYPPSKLPKLARVVVIDEAPFKGHMVHQVQAADDYLEGDVATTLTLLAEAVRRLGIDQAAVATRRRQAAEAHAAARAQEQALVAKARQSAGITAINLCATLGEVLPGDTIYLDETTSQRGLNYKHIGFSGLHSFLRVPTGLGQCLGVGLGVKLAAQERPVACLVGDGSFLYNPVLPALSLARDLGRPLIVVVFNNGGYRSMASNHASFYPDGVAKRSGIFVGETLNPVDCIPLAASVGAVGIRVEAAPELPAAIRRALEATREGRSAILDVVLQAPAAR